MPATAGRVRMPANNRVHSSAALQTHGIWQSAIGYDPYAPTAKEDNKKSSTTVKASNSAEPETENAYASFQGLLALARITNSNSDEARGSCKKCGRVGHLTFQCRNFLSVKEEVSKGAKDDDVMLREVVLEKLKGKKVKGVAKMGGVESAESSEEEEDDEDSESSDSDYDSEMERIIAGKYGKKASGKVKVASRREEEDGEGERRKKRGRSKKRRSGKRENSDSEDDDERKRKRRKEKRRGRDDDESSDGEEERRRRRKRKSRKERRRRRSHRHSSDYSDASSEDYGDRRHKRRSRKINSTADSYDSGSDDPRVGRDKKRSEKKSRKSRHEAGVGSVQLCDLTVDEWDHFRFCPWSGIEIGHAYVPKSLIRDF